MGTKNVTYLQHLKRNGAHYSAQFFLGVIVLLMFAKPLLPVVDYFQNYDYIVKVLCENKEKPMLECNGKCYLSKLLAEEADDESNPFSEKLSKYEIPLLLHESESLEIEFELSEKRIFENLVMNGGILYSLDFTRPPEITSV
ncbi:hypothetical protein [Euzebyella saccharophila]|uniref:Uncharacterized protein n=1 Tax=Euzebyella saccharophila TaxID=679664 RepID=A0ABV8JU10_9FLAO|nr:hypothetical protein [Euzebyella saccharophila]